MKSFSFLPELAVCIVPLCVIPAKWADSCKLFSDGYTVPSVDQVWLFPQSITKHNGLIFVYLYMLYNIVYAYISNYFHAITLSYTVISHAVHFQKTW